MRTAVLLASLLFAAAASAAETIRLTESSATYTISWNGISLGDATITLKLGDKPDCYRYESTTHPIGLVRMLYGSPHEISEFCVAGGKVVPRRFEFIKDKGDDGNFTLDFDMAALKVRDGKGQEREIPANAQDRFGMQQAVRLWVLAQLKQKDPGAGQFEASLVDDRRVKQGMRFVIAGRETIDIPAGRFDTIVVQRVDDPKKAAKFWIAPERDYMPVKVEQIRGGKSDLRMQLKK